jgi:hypothetical protein
MKLMAKFGIFALAVVMMAILACGGDDEEAEQPAAPATAKPAATAVPMSHRPQRQVPVCPKRAARSGGSLRLP